MTHGSLLFEPFPIRSARMENRIVLTAMVTRLAGEDGFVNDRIRDRYIRFAEGRPGMIVLEAMAVHQSRSGPLLRICGDEYIAGLADLYQKMRERSPSLVVPQIIHFLKISRSGYRQTVADLSAGEILSIRDAYAAAAERARRAGFDGVELHMAHAYTLSSFLSKRNMRPDEYGRSFENRLRLPSEVLAAVRSAVGSDFPVGVRFLSEECIKDGATVEETKYTALRFSQLGADWLSLSNGGKFEDAIRKPGEPLYPYTGYSGDRCMPGRQYPDATGAPAASAIRAFLRAHGATTPVVVSGKIHTKALAEEILQKGGADWIGMARPLLADPDLPEKWRRGDDDRVIGCVYSNVCKSLDEAFKEVRCYLWPRGAMQAPRASEAMAGTAPGLAWPEGGAHLAARVARGRVELEWRPAVPSERVYGYEIHRREPGSAPQRLYATKNTHYHDDLAAGGMQYQYTVRAYDFAGGRCEISNEVRVDMNP
jgi:2,4-dienoyl-CoA reductase-like NADH-dependent reductase (Old Yellow Enzyme family)